MTENSIQYTPLEEIPNIVSKIRKNYEEKGRVDFAYREKQLKALIAMYEENEEKWKEALYADLKQNPLVSFTEFTGSPNEAKYLLNNLKKLMASQTVSTSNPMLYPGTSTLVPEPLGVALIISPWNYPITLLGKPLAGAIAAGNAVVVKPSEVSVNTSKLYAELIPKYLDNSRITIISGGVSETTVLLNERFDYIFYTGSTEVGKIVMTSAAKHLTPVTLELGGKSPCYIDSELEWSITLKRLVWGKWTNVGQTCIAPDYVLVKRSVREKLVEGIKEHIKLFYGENPKESNDFTRIISERHVKRLEALIEEHRENGNIIIGGEVDIEDKYIAPTLILNPDVNSKVMKEEIFGPILPIIDVENHEEAIRFINSREKPLALYVFSKSNKVLNDFTEKTSSGGLCLNDTLVHVLDDNLPFGGVGYSGMGSYNGDSTFKTFTHYKPVLNKSARPLFDASMRYPPYTPEKMRTVKLFSGLKTPKCSIM